MNNKTPEEISMMLRKMHMSSMAEEYMDQMSDTNAELMPFEERFNKIVEAEWDARYNKKFQKFLKKAALRYPEASLDDSIYDTERELDTNTIEALLDYSWIENGRNLIITGKSGGGKSYFSNVLAVNALRQFKTVKYTKSRNLIYDLEKAHLENNYIEYLNAISKNDLIIMDDFGLMELDFEKCRYLFELIDAREGRKSIIIVSQLPVNSWYSLFKDNTYADACLDRLVFKAYRLEFNGKNMRNPNL